MRKLHRGLKRTVHDNHSVFIPPKLLLELNREAERLDRSVSWLLRAAWQVARSRIALLKPPA